MIWLCDGQKLKAGSQRLKTEKSALYREYKTAREEMKTVVTAKANIDHLLNLTGEAKVKEQSR